MAFDGDAAVLRARALVGVRFRPQGRDAERGLDCVGLVAMALGRGPASDDYALRGGGLARVEQGLRTAGLVLASDALPGDVLVMRSGPEQLHLGVWTGAGLVHADARLRRVAERPGAPAWPVLGIWRLED